MKHLPSTTLEMFPHWSHQKHPGSWGVYGEDYGGQSWTSGDEGKFLKMLACQSQLLAECYSQQWIAMLCYC